MFTGIVEETGTVVSAGDSRLSISASLVMDDLKVSDSVSVNGACLTVTTVEGSRFSVDTVPETLRRTNLGGLARGDLVNLERPMKANGRFGGHVVQGHVDGVGETLSITPEGEARNIQFEAPSAIMRYIVEKGFVAVDGVSLTVVNCDDRTFTVTIIPYTWDHTVFSRLERGDAVNLEADIIAKYVERLASGPRFPLDVADEL